MGTSQRKGGFYDSEFPLYTNLYSRNRKWPNATEKCTNNVIFIPFEILGYKYRYFFTESNGGRINFEMGTSPEKSTKIQIQRRGVQVKVGYNDV